MHTSVGMIIEKEGKILMMDRKKFPLGWACPAGHKEEKENPSEAAIRETLEESGIEVEECEEIFHEFVSWNECDVGEKGHDWFVFKASKWNGKAKKEDEEAHSFQFFPYVFIVLFF